MPQSDSAISGISSPIGKCATAIGAAVGANSGVAQDVAQTAGQAVLSTTQNIDWFSLIMAQPWDKIASILAAFYTLAIFSEWLWKKPIRWFLSKCGVITPQPRFSESELAELRKK